MSVAMLTGLRRCRTCQQEKPLTEFHVNYWSQGGRLQHCKDCTRDQRRKRQRLGAVDERELARSREFPFVVVFHGGPDDELTYRVKSEPGRYWRAEHRSPLCMDKEGSIFFAGDWVNVWTYERTDFDGSTAHYVLRGVEVGRFCIAA